jgi:hypothetical protein
VHDWMMLEMIQLIILGWCSGLEDFLVVVGSDLLVRDGLKVSRDDYPWHVQYSERCSPI